VVRRACRGRCRADSADRHPNRARRGRPSAFALASARGGAGAPIVGAQDHARDAVTLSARWPAPTM
jgi:hypothetical protein